MRKLQLLWSRFWIFLFVTPILMIQIGPFWAWHWINRWAIAVGVGSFLYTVWFSRRTSWAFFPILALTIWSAIYSGLWILNLFSQESDLAFRGVLEKDAMYGLICVFLATFAIAITPNHHARTLRLSIMAVFALAVGWTWSQVFATSYERIGFVGNASQNGCLIACLFPFVYQYIKGQYKAWAFQALTLVTVALSGASQPFGVFALTFGAYLYAVHPNKWKASFWTALVFADVFLLGKLLQPTEFFSSDGRLHAYAQTMAWWSNHAPFMTGMGLGSSTHLLGAIQLVDRVNIGGDSAVFLWMHSEPLQIIFELGFLGLLFSLLAYGVLLYKAARKPAIFASLIGFAGFSLFNYPLHLASTATPWIMVIALALREHE